MTAPQVRVCFVCLGNICRSPTAEAVMTTLVDDAALTGHVGVDSAGTAGWHEGDPPDHRTVEAAARRGIEMSHLRGRQFRRADFDRFDLVLAMDHDNRRDLLRLAGAGAGSSDRVRLLREFDPLSAGGDPLGFDLAVPDPYYGGADGFDLVLDLVDAACRGLLAHLREAHRLQ